jgi:hypothetical protein
MRKETPNVFIPAPESFKDDKGNTLTLEVKPPTFSYLADLREKYNKVEPAYDKNGNNIIFDNQIVFNSKFDSRSFNNRIIADCIVSPNFKDEEFMETFNCYDVARIAELVFSNSKDLNYVLKKILESSGVVNDISEDIEEAKNE